MAIHYAPHSTSAYDRSLQRNCAAYQLIFEIENFLREQAAHLLIEEFGQKWLKQGIPADIREKISNGIRYEKGTSWQKSRLHNPLYYIDFPDLKKIIINGTNWRVKFEEIFLNKSNVDTSLTDVEAIRNKIAHNRIISDSELSILRSSHIKLIRSISEDSIKEIKQKISGYLSVPSELNCLLNSLTDILINIESGDPITLSSLNGLRLRDNWWFDDVYLGSNLSTIEEFCRQCELYAQIPAGLGQAIARRSWASERNLSLMGREAKRDISAMLAPLEIYDA